MKEFFEVVEARTSIRQFQPQPVEPEQLERILKAANRAPSAGNLQAYRIIIVTDPQMRGRLEAASGNQGSVAGAPVVLVFCACPSESAARYGARGKELYCVQDATIACAYAQLAVTALGLGSVWIGAVFEPDVIKDVLRLGEGLWPVALLPIGVPAEQPPRTPRRPLRETVRER